MIIAVDGPSGSGKSSTARGVASRLGLRYLDTGATYRAVTWSALEHGLDLDDTAAVAQRSRELRLEVSIDPANQFVIADGTDVTTAIREPRISETVSKIATNLDVRKELIRRQREIIDDAQPTGGIVVEGRDIGTVVATDSELKVLLTADQDGPDGAPRRRAGGRGGDRRAAPRPDRPPGRRRRDRVGVPGRVRRRGHHRFDASVPWRRSST